MPESEATGTGLMCFLQPDRYCNGDCMAYSITVPEGPTYTGEKWPHCQILLNVERGARHLTILTQQAAKFFKQVSDSEADKSRHGTPPEVK